MLLRATERWPLGVIACCRLLSGCQRAGAWRLFVRLPGIELAAIWA